MPFTFEILDPNVIVASLFEVGLELSTTDITQPDAKVMRQVYQHLVEQIMSVSKDEMMEPDMQIIDRSVMFPELHSHSIPELMFFMKLRDLMRRVQVTDFRRSDVTHPDYRRTVRNLSAIINFLKFRAERQVMFERLHSDLENLSTEYDRKCQEMAMLEATVKDAQAQYRSNVDQADHIKAEVVELEKEVGRLNEYQADLKSENSALKQTHREEKERKENIHYLVLTIRKEITRLKNNIVPSPEKLKQSLAELEESVEMEKVELRKADAESKTIQEKLDSLNRLEKEVHRCIATLEEFAVDMGKLEELKDEVRAAKKQSAEKEKARAEQEAAVAATKRQLQSAQEKLDRLEEKHSLKHGAAANALEEALNEREHAEKENLALEQKMQQLEENKRAVEQSMVRMQREHAEVLHTLSSRYNEMEGQVESYHAGLLHALHARN